MQIDRILGDSWNLYTRFFTRFVIVAGAFYLVLGLVTALLGQAGSGGTAALLALISLVVVLVGGYWVQGALVEATIDVRDGRADVPVGELFSRISPILAALIGAGVLAGLGILVGFILLIVPGLYLMTRWAVIVPVIVIEKSGVMAAFTRSNQLITGNGWKVFAIVIIVAIASAIASGILGGVLAAILPEFLGDWLGTAVGGALTAPFGAIAVTLMYVELSRAKPASAA